MVALKTINISPVTLIDFIKAEQFNPEIGLSSIFSSTTGGTHEVKVEFVIVTGTNCWL